MLSVPTARALHRAGLAWQPAPGDRFVVMDRGMDEDVFVVSDLVVEHHRTASGDQLRFNGTTEWALDQLPVEQALWLPREDQLRVVLGPRFVALAQDTGGWVVTTREGGAHRHADPEEAYAAAVLAG